VKLKAAQTEFFTYTALLRVASEALGQLLVKVEWGGLNRSAAGRAGLMEMLFGRVMVGNSQRAVKDKVPAEYRKIKELWEEIVDELASAPANEAAPASMAN